MTDLSTIPVEYLSSKTKLCLSSLLNPTKIIPSCNGLSRDWRGVADLLGLSGEIIPSVALSTDPINYIFDFLIKNEDINKYTIKDLINVLEGIERWDVIDDAQPMFEKDAERYLKQQQSSQKSAESLDDEIESKLLTVDDIYRAKEGLQAQLYDAFLLYADEDETFAEEMIEKLEIENNLKLCLKNRDLISGITFEHEAIMQLISERCNRLIIIITSNFLKSSANKFFVNYAQAISIEKAQRKIIPCMYENCTLPAQLKYMFVLDYSKSKSKSKIYDFWGRLNQSVRSAKPIDFASKKCEIDNKLQKENHFPEESTSECISNSLEKQTIKETVKNGFVSTLSSKPEKVSSKSLKTFRLFSKPRKSNTFNSSESNEVNNLPSLDDLDPLDSLSIEKDENSKTKLKKYKFINSCKQKMKRLAN